MRQSRRREAPSKVLRRRKSATLLACVVISMLAVATGVEAACNLIPSDPDRFQSVIGATNRPFAGPGDTIEIGIVASGCDARSAGATGRDAASYVATYVFQPRPQAAADVIVIASDCAARAAAIDNCRAKPGVGRVQCRAAKGPGAMTAIEVLERKGAAVFSVRFPDTDALVGGEHDGLTLTGPVRIALTASSDPLPCALASSSCAALPDEEKLVACIDEMHSSDGNCALDAAARHGAFPVFLALPPMNPATATSSPDAAFAGRDVLATRDASGSLVIPIDWRPPGQKVLDKGGSRLRGQSAVDVLRTRLGATPALKSANVGVFTAWGRALPAVYDPNDSAALLSLFDQLEVPLTVLRVSPRVCAGGVASGRACSSDAECTGSTCGPAAFELPASSASAGGPEILAATAGDASASATGNGEQHQP